jgi:hypothetical protein
MRRRVRSWVVVTAGLAALAPLVARGQPIRPAVADPAYGYYVEGRVLRQDGRPARGVVVERAETMFFVAESRTTDARGAFAFEGHGLGPGPGSSWRLVVRRRGCPDAVRTVALTEGTYDGRPVDKATGIVWRLPRCAPRH